MLQSDPDIDENEPVPEIREEVIPGLDGKYLMNTDGQIFSLKGGKRKILKPYQLASRSGGPRSERECINLCIRGKPQRYYLMDLACLTFLGPKPTPLHRGGTKDGSKYNYNIQNLEWQTQADRLWVNKDSRATKLAEEFKLKQARDFTEKFEYNLATNPEIQKKFEELYPGRERYDITNEELNTFLLTIGELGLAQIKPDEKKFLTSQQDGQTIDKPKPIRKRKPPRNPFFGRRKRKDKKWPTPEQID